jgi:hypothetical protein
MTTARAEDAVYARDEGCGAVATLFDTECMQKGRSHGLE